MDQYIGQAFSWINGILYSSTYRFNTMLAFIDCLFILTPPYQTTYEFISKGKHPKVQP